MIRDRLSEYREGLRVSHLIVTRLRISGIERSEAEASMAELAALVD